VRLRQLALIVDGYGLEPSAREGLVEKMIEFATRSAREEAVVRRAGGCRPGHSIDGLLDSVVDAALHAACGDA
jgi:hypothetical protein